MKSIARIVGLTALLITFLSPILFLNGVMAESVMKSTLLACTILWFVTAPMWMKAGDH